MRCGSGGMATGSDKTITEIITQLPQIRKSFVLKNSRLERITYFAANFFCFLRVEGHLCDFPGEKPYLIIYGALHRYEAIPILMPFSLKRKYKGEISSFFIFTKKAVCTKKPGQVPKTLPGL